MPVAYGFLFPLPRFGPAGSQDKQVGRVVLSLQDRITPNFNNCANCAKLDLESRLF